MFLAADEGDTEAVAAWLDEGGGVDAPCAERGGPTLLMAAVSREQQALVRMLLQRRASVNLQTSHGMTALMYAALEGYTTIVQALLDAKADASLQSIKGKTALMTAEQGKHTAAARLLRQHAKQPTAEAEARAAELPGAMFIAANEGDTQAVAAWLDEGGGVDTAGGVDAACGDMTLLLMAAAGGQEAMVRMLLQRGASVNLQNRVGCTAMMYAAIKGYTTIVQALLEAKADASMQHSGGKTALNAAEQEKHTAAAQLLRQHAERQAAEAEARAAASMVHAAAAANASAAELLAEVEAEEKEAAAKKGKGKKKKAKAAPSAVAADPEAAASPASMPAVAESLPPGVLLAAKEGGAQAVAAWVDAGGGVDAGCAYESVTLLMAAAAEGRVAMVRMLLQRGASVNVQDYVGLTALMWCAVGSGNTTIVQALLDAKADASLQTINGDTVLMWAERDKHTATAQLLRQHAAAAADAAAEELLAAEEAEKEAAAKKGKGKKKKATAAPSAVATESAPTAGAPKPVAAEAGLPEAVRLAVREGDAQAVAAWLHEGGGVDARDQEHCGSTLLMAASGGGHAAIVRVLLQRGASISLRDSVGATALMYAAANGHTTSVQTLLDAKADASLQIKSGYTALGMAEQQKHTATAQLLRQHAKRQAAEAEARAGASMAHAEAKAEAAATELLGEVAAEKEAAAKKGKGKKQKAKPAPKATATGADSSADPTSAVPALPSQPASGPQEEARAAAAAQKVATAAAAEQAQTEVNAAERAAVKRAAEEERALEEGVAQSVASHAAEEQRRAAIQAASPPPATTQPPCTAPLPPPSPSPPPAGPLVLTYLELQTATGDFAQVVGTGGFASVYRTEGALPSLPHHGPCAVKRLTVDADAAGGAHAGRGGRRGGGRGGAGRGGGRGGRGCGGVAMEVLKEVALLGRCSPHASLLPLLGYCLEASRQPCLVYPLCAGGTLEDRLLPSSAGFGRLAALGWAELPAPLTWLQRLTILRDAARGLVHLHAQQPVLLHGDIKPSNILLDARGEARLADFGLARVAKQRGGTDATVASVSAVCGTAAFLDPIYLHDGVATELTDGFAFGVTVLMALTGLPAAGIKQRCRHMLKWPKQPPRWQPPGVPDLAAGSWDDGASSDLLEVIQGLNENWAEERMPLPDVLGRLEAMVVAATVSSSEAEAEAAAEARVCIICEEAPREVRFACGHALVCNGCLPVVVEQCKKCPTCDRPFGAQPVAERGTHVRGAPTFVLPK